MKKNNKKEQLISELFIKVKARFPEIVFKNLEVSPIDKDHIWIVVTANMDEDTEIKMTEYAAQLETEILMDFGYAISIMSENPNSVYA